jgi:hypothetical protein
MDDAEKISNAFKARIMGNRRKCIGFPFGVSTRTWANSSFPFLANYTQPVQERFQARETILLAEPLPIFSMFSQ